MIFDSHSHIDDSKLKKIQNDIINNLHNDNLCGIINVGCDYTTSVDSFNLSQENENVYCALGIHPSDCDTYNLEFEKFVIEKSKNKKVVAIGEIGLDYHYPDTNKELQKEIFVKQILLADALKLPIIIHTRDALVDTLNILKKYSNFLNNGGVIHCFSGSYETCKEFLKLGFYLGIGGTITYENNKVNNFLNKIPLSRILLETDCPYLTPLKLKGTINQPKNVNLVLDHLVEKLNLNKSDFEKIILDNVKTLFKKIEIKD